jgi:2-succinyl-5-enolpyruvyl-6-hydroxy-3-cyclohexene-1-carboxylate synthase
MSASTQATFCATLVDEWARAGVAHAVVAPGSRSTPLALALAADDRVRVHVFHDERAAAFAALGIGLASKRPAVLLCTSGTAATHLHAAVVEADLSCVPLLVCTADEAMRGTWRSIAARAVLEATRTKPGPVHLNLPFRDPLVGEPGDLPEGRLLDAPWTSDDPSTLTEVALPQAQRPLVVAGPGVTPAIATLGWPILADVASGVSGSTVIEHADALLRDAATAERLRPDVVLRVGRPPASRIVNEWLAATGAEELVVSGSWSDPGHTAARVLPPHAELALPAAPAHWLGEWRRADDAAEAAIAATLGRYTVVTEPQAARSVVAALPADAQLVVASSMPIRDVESFAPRRSDLDVYANRGANGIDGTISTAIGIALATGQKTVVLLGDIAFLHDSTALIASKARGIDLTIVVIDNDGGGIFSFLPQAGALEADRFELLYGTPHGVRPEAVAAAHGIASVTVEDPEALAPSLRSTIATGSVWLVVVRTDRTANVIIHDELNAAVAKALSGA